MAINQDITDLPTPPQRSDPSNFDSRADSFLSALDDLASEINTWADEANTLASQVNSNKNAAQTAEQDAQDAEQGAKDAKNAAEAAANASPWGSGTTYSEGDAVIGSDGNTYRSLTDSNTGNDPTTSPGEWKRLTTSLRWIAKSSAYTASAGDHILADTSGSAFTVTLPSNPLSGDEAIHFSDAGRSWGTNALTVDGNGNNILGASTFTADVDDWAFSLVYNGTQWIFAQRP